MHDFENLLDQQRRKTHGRFVEQDHARSRHHGAADHGHLLLAARGVAGKTFAAFTQPREIAIDLVEILRDAGTVATAREGAGQQVLLDGEMDEAVAALHHLDKAATDHLRRRKTIDAFAGEFYAALGDVTAFRPQQVGDRLERRGLAGAVGPEKGDDAPLGNRQRHATQHQDDVIVDHLDVVDRKQVGAVIAVIRG